MRRGSKAAGSFWKPFSLDLKALWGHSSTVRFFIHSFVIIALMLSGISPACAFLSGQVGVIEICAADGSVKTILVSEELDPMGLLPGENQKTIKSDCAFCMASGSLKGNVVKEFAITLVSHPTGTLSIGPGSIIQPSAPSVGFSPTGPPAFFVI